MRISMFSTQLFPVCQSLKLDSIILMNDVYTLRLYVLYMSMHIAGIAINARKRLRKIHQLTVYVRLKPESGHFSVQNCPHIPSTTITSMYIAYGRVKIIESVHRIAVIHIER